MANTPGDYKQLLQLATALIRKAGGTVRLSAADIHDSEPPKGFTRRWDNDAREMVISLVEHGTSLFLSDEEGGKWQTNQQQAQQVERIVQPQMDRIIQQAWAGNEAGQDKTHAILDDERQLAFERERVKQQALKDILEFPMERELPSNRSSRPQTSNQTSAGMPRQYFRESGKGL